jgi:hypothetical protein
MWRWQEKETRQREENGREKVVMEAENKDRHETGREKKEKMIEQGAKKKERQEWRGGGGAGERKTGRGGRNSPWGLRMQADEVHSNVKYLKVVFQEIGGMPRHPPSKLHFCANVHICPCSLLETCFVHSID